MVFTWYELGTTDLDAAQTFYAAVMGWSAQRTDSGCIFYLGPERVGGLALLLERARALGAPPHWIGHIGVPDVDAWASKFIAAGGEIRGEVRRSARGSVAVLRGPQGEALALSSRSDGPSPAVVWHELYTPDSERAWSSYSALLGWRSTGMLDPEPPIGAYRTFSWDGTDKRVGGMASTARAPHIHPQWLFYLAIPDLDKALERVRALGGTAIGPTVLPSGDRIAQCEDAQGAAFALRESSVVSY